MSLWKRIWLRVFPGDERKRTLDPKKIKYQGGGFISVDPEKALKENWELIKRIQKRTFGKSDD